VFVVIAWPWLAGCICASRAYAQIQRAKEKDVDWADIVFTVWFASLFGYPILCGLVRASIYVATNQ